MTIVRVNIVFLVILWSSALALEEMKRLDPAKAGFSTERLLKISSGMQKYIDDELTPGVLTAIARKGKIIHLETQGYMPKVLQIHAALAAIRRATVLNC